MTPEKDILLFVEENNPNYRLFFGTQTIQPRKSLSEIEILLAWGVLFLVSAGLYIHLDVVPFLPIQFSQETAELVKLFAFLGLGISLLLPLAAVLLIVYDSLSIYIKRSLKGPACIVCATCGACTPIFRYTERKDDHLLVHGCSKCGSLRVYCAKCGKSASIEHYFQGEGCPHCGHPFLLAKKN